MLHQFQNHLSTHFPFLKGKKLLLAVSGGLDSMVLLHLFQQSDFEIIVLHCNFQLRGLESFGDQQFVQEYTSQHTIPFVFTQFDTEAFANDYKLSTQVAARELRYSWFYEQLEIQDGDYILTAHHADDAFETTLINLIRGTGLEGLTGIPAQNELVIRPLLPFSRDEILEYAQKNKEKLEKLKKLKQSGGRKKRLPDPQTIPDKSKKQKESERLKEINDYLVKLAWECD